MVAVAIGVQPRAAATAAAVWVSTMAIAQGAAVEARLMFAVRATRGTSSQGEEAAVTVRDLSEAEPGTLITVAEALATRGFATLRPALGDKYFDQEEFKARLQDQDPAAAAAILAQHLSDPDSQEFGWVTCGVPVERRAQPGSVEPLAPVCRQGDGNQALTACGAPAHTAETPAILRALLLRLPSVARLLTVWLPLRVLVQPLALLDARTFDPIIEGSRLAAVGGLSPPAPRKPGQRWWWHSNLDFGDAIVLDALRCPHSTFTLPGETTLMNTLENVARLRTTLPGGKLAIRPGSSAPSLKDAEKVCNEFDPALLEPAPYPVVGERYSVFGEPSTLVRRLESVESDVIGELRPGGVVTILGVGQEGPGRAKVYTEHAIVAMEGFTDGGDLPGVSPGSRATSMTGWVSSENYDGERLLQPLSAPPAGESPPAALASYLADIGSTLRGICSWVNITIAAANSTAPSASASWHSAQISDRHERTLATLLDKAQHHSFQVQCLAVSLPGRNTQAAAAAAGTMLAILVGSWLMRPCC